jgi:hypothetical protein
MALHQVEDNFVAYGDSVWPGIPAKAVPASDVFRLRNELANLLEAWAVEIGAEGDVDATQFAERMLASGWSK